MASSEQEEFYYSPRYEDDYFEYRHVHVPMSVAKKVPRSRLMTETEWRSLGIQQSVGWVHYLIHAPERHVLLFRRTKPGVDPKVAEAVAKQREAGKEDPPPKEEKKPEEQPPPKKKSDEDNDGDESSSGTSSGIEAMRIR